jgi:hypothetical protein
MTEHSQETKIAILEAKVEHMMGHVKELTLRVRANEKVVASVSLLGVIACTIVGAGYFAPRAEACSLPADGRPANCPEDWELGVKPDPIPVDPQTNNWRAPQSGRTYAEKYPSYLEPRTQQPYEGMLPDNSNTINNWMGRMRQWELEQSIKDPAFDINSALAEYFNNGGTETTEQEELLQLQSSDNRQSIGWRYD